MTLPRSELTMPPSSSHSIRAKLKAGGSIAASKLWSAVAPRLPSTFGHQANPGLAELGRGNNGGERAVLDNPKDDLGKPPSRGWRAFAASMIRVQDPRSALGEARIVTFPQVHSGIDFSIHSIALTLVAHNE
jgi:hypothetical protein